MARPVHPQTLRRLTYFAAIADAGSIRQAARQLGLSVASVSEALSALEEELGVNLATRNTRRLQLTEEGRRVAGVAERTLAAASDLYSDSDDPAGLVGQVALTVPVEVAQSWLPAKLEGFGHTHPKVALSVSVSDHVVDLSQSPFDLAIRARYIPPGPMPEDVPHKLPLICVSASALPLVPHPAGWFASVPLISHRAGNTLDVWDPVANQRRAIEFASVIRVDNKHVSLAMVARGMGAALVSEGSAASFPGLIPSAPHLAFGEIRLDFEMRDKRPSRAARALRAYLSAS